MERLVNEAKKGNTDAFTELILNIKDNLYKIARMRFSEDNDINDAVQETIIIAYENLHKLRKPKYFKTWIIRILINECNKLYRNKIKNNQLIEYSEENIKIYNKENNIDTLSNNLDFKILIENLDYKERITLTLFYAENLTSKEISKILKEPESTIRNRISRAKIKLKKKLEGGIYNE